MPDGKTFDELLITCGQCRGYQTLLEEAKCQLILYDQVRNQFLLKYEKTRLGSEKQRLDIDVTNYDPKNNVTDDTDAPTNLLVYDNYPP